MKNLVLGSESMLGRHLGKILPDYFGVTHKEFDLLDLEQCKSAFVQAEVDNETVVYNLAGRNGGIIANLAIPADIYYESAQINLNILRCCQLFNINRVVNIISACAYCDTTTEMKEDELLNGYPNSTVECHGFAKRTIFEYSRQLHKQYGVKSICTVLTNCYGDYDRFDLNRTKVVGAVVRKMCEAVWYDLPQITFRGTGSAVREMMYAGDAAACLVKLADVYDDYMNPVNIGSGQTISIRELVNKISFMVGYKGDILWDTTQADGQAYRKLSTERMNKYISHEMTPFDVGLKNTIEYYRKVGRYLDR